MTKDAFASIGVVLRFLVRQDRDEHTSRGERLHHRNEAVWSRQRESCLEVSRAGAIVSGERGDSRQFTQLALRARFGEKV